MYCVGLQLGIWKDEFMDTYYYLLFASMYLQQLLTYKIVGCSSCQLCVVVVCTWIFFQGKRLS